MGSGIQIFFFFTSFLRLYPESSSGGTEIHSEFFYLHFVSGKWSSWMNIWVISNISQDLVACLLHLEESCSYPGLEVFQLSCILFMSFCSSASALPCRGMRYSWIHSCLSRFLLSLQVITLEGWVEIMYYVMDAHSFYNFIYFILLIIVSMKWLLIVVDSYL